MRGVKVNLEMQAGSAFARDISLVPAPPGNTYLMHVRDYPDDVAPLLVVSSASGDLIETAVPGGLLLSIRLAATRTAALPVPGGHANWHYDIISYTNAGDVRTVVYGRILVTKNITR